MTTSKIVEVSKKLWFTFLSSMCSYKNAAALLFINLSKKIDESARMTRLLVNYKASVSFKFGLLFFALDKGFKPSSNETSITMKSSTTRVQRSTMVSKLASGASCPGFDSQHY